MDIREQQIEVPFDGQTEVPCSIWSASDEPCGIVLIGHGLGVDRYDATVRRPMEVLARGHDALVVVPEIPLHGVRDQFPDDPSGIVERWQNYWVSGGIDTIAAEFLALIDFCTATYPGLPITYFGASLGTQYGIVLLSQTSDVQAAVLGLFGSHPPPKTPVMNRFAPAVKCPVFFMQKRDDEIHSAQSTTHLFSTLGSEEKLLDSTAGRHTEVSMATLRSSCAFLVAHGHFSDARPTKQPNS